MAAQLALQLRLHEALDWTEGVLQVFRERAKLVVCDPVSRALAQGGAFSQGVFSHASGLHEEMWKRLAISSSGWRHAPWL